MLIPENKTIYRKEFLEMIIALALALIVFVCIIVGLCVYLLMGTWVAFLIAALCCLITICVTLGVVSIVRIIKNKKERKESIKE